MLRTAVLFYPKGTDENRPKGGAWAQAGAGRAPDEAAVVCPEAGVLDAATSATLWYDTAQEQPQPGSPLSLQRPGLLGAQRHPAPVAGLQPPSLVDVQTDTFVPHFPQRPGLMGRLPATSWWPKPPGQQSPLVRMVQGPGGQPPQPRAGPAAHREVALQRALAEDLVSTRHGAARHGLARATGFLSSSAARVWAFCSLSALLP